MLSEIYLNLWLSFLLVVLTVTDVTSLNLVKQRTGKQRYACNNPECPYHTFTLEPHAYPGRRQ